MVQRIVAGAVRLLTFTLAALLAACGGGVNPAGVSPGGVNPSGGTTTPPPTIRLLAGNLGGWGNVDATGAGASFNCPGYAASDTAGNLYVTDSCNHNIRKITPAGVVTTLAGSPTGVAGAADGVGTAASFNRPLGIAIDAAGTNLYVADSFNDKIRKIVIATGTVSSLTGTANTSMMPGAADGAAATASFNLPQDIAIDAAGANLYVVDSSNIKIRKIVLATSMVSSLTGTANTAMAAGATDGAAATASFNLPQGITIDAAGANLYVADGNNKIRKIVLATGTVSSLTGTANTVMAPGAADGPAATASFTFPQGIVMDPAGANLYVVDSSNNKIRKIVLATGTVSSLTGTANTAMAMGAMDGPAATASFTNPQGITLDAAGNLYVADIFITKIRKITPAGIVSTLAGSTSVRGSADGTGAAASFNGLGYAAHDAAGNLYVTDLRNHNIRKITPAGVVTTLAGSPPGVAGTGAWGGAGAADGTGTAATFSSPRGIAIDPAGANLYVVDSANNKIRQIVIATGVVSSLTGTANTSMMPGAADGAAATASFNLPEGITIDAAGANLYVADGNNKIRKIVIATGMVSSLTGAANTAMAAGATDGAAATASFNLPEGITLDTAGANLYVADRGNNKIRQIVLATGTVSSLTGTANTAMAAGVTDGPAATASFNWPHDIALGAAGNLYVGDDLNYTIRKITPSGIVSTVVGTAGRFGFVDGSALPGFLRGPSGITVSGGSLYISDGGTGIAVVNSLP